MRNRSEVDVRANKDGKSLIVKNEESLVRD